MDRNSVARGIEYHVVTSGFEPPENVSLYNALYSFWHEQWTKTLSELDGPTKLHADEFTRQGEKTFFTFNGEIIAAFCLSWFHLGLLSHREHSYFTSYPPETLEFLKAQGLERVMTMGWLCTSRSWRRSEMGSLITDSLVLLGYRRFLHSAADTLIAFTRNDRKINDLVYRNGSKCLRSGVSAHNVEVDIIYTLKKDVRESEDPVIRETVNRLWDQRIIHGPVAPMRHLRKVA
jgi:hypothetical protein